MNDANLASAFFRLAEENTDKNLLVAKRDGDWQAMTFGEVAHAVRCLASVLVELNVKAGDRVLIAAENSPEWAIADLAIMAIGGIVVPSFITNTEDDFRYIIEHSGASVGVASGGAIANSVIKAGEDCKGFRNLLVLGDAATKKKGKKLEVASWDDALKASSPLPDLDKRLQKIKEDDVCCFIYTSGTGGKPKGVMLTHRSMQSNVDGAKDLLAEGGISDNQRFLSILPLSHSYEHTVGLHFPLQTRSEIWYCEGSDKLVSNLQEASPSLMTAVPRLYEVMYDRITRGVEAKGGLSKKLFYLAVELGTKVLRGERLTMTERLLNRALDKLVRRKVRARFGGKLQFFISGGAALNPDIGYFFTALGVNILQGYGQTESSPIISANRPNLIKMKTVGPPLKGVDVQLAADGEILVRGDLVMKGYWQDDAATAATIIDDWLHTGDVGEIDADGYITITGRKKEIIVNAGGDNIALSRVESVMTLEPEIEQVMIDGDGKPWLAAVIVPSESLLSEGLSDDDLNKALSDAVGRANKKLAVFERVRRFIIADEPFTAANAQMTPTLKIRRHIIKEIYGPKINALYPKK